MSLVRAKCDYAGCFRPAVMTIGKYLAVTGSEYCEFHQELMALKQPETVKHRFAPTVFIDLDGVLVQHRNPMTWYDPLEILPGVHETFTKWWNAGVKIIITTGRPTSNRQRLEEELSRLGIFYHQLVMDCGSGIRYLINDVKPYNPSRATAISLNVARNEGLNK